MDIELSRTFAKAKPVPDSTPPGLVGHDVQFYRSDAFLVRRVTDFLAAGAKAGQPLVVIATQPHREAFAAIEVRSGASDSLVGISVADSGVGIPDNKLEEIFEPFVQIERSLTSPMEGAGLGLAISRDLARAMGGDVAVRSRLGEGSVFTFELPLASELSPAYAALANEDLSALQREA